jgi:hypothetical protein
MVQCRPGGRLQDGWIVKLYPVSDLIDCTSIEVITWNSWACNWAFCARNECWRGFRASSLLAGAAVVTTRLAQTFAAKMPGNVGAAIAAAAAVAKRRRESTSISYACDVPLAHEHSTKANATHSRPAMCMYSCRRRAICCRTRGRPVYRSCPAVGGVVLASE